MVKTKKRAIIKGRKAKKRAIIKGRKARKAKKRVKKR